MNVSQPTNKPADLLPEPKRGLLYYVRKAPRALLNRYRLYGSMVRFSRKTRVIVCSGMQRSGSTWLFNVVRLIIQQEEPDKDVGQGWIADLHTFYKHPIVIVKAHDYYPLLALRGHTIFASYRDIRDVAASFRRMFKRPLDGQGAARLIQQHERWRSIADYTMRYEDMLSDPERVAKRIAEALGYADLDVAPIVNKIESMKFDRKRAQGKHYEPDSQLHENHVTDGRHGSWVGSLDETVIREIEEQCGTWLRANQYM